MAEWKQIPCDERDELFREGILDSSLMVLASSTDPEKYIFTEWGDRETAVPVLRDHRWPDRSHPCKHEVPA